jgi:hypothetical protein
MANFHEFLEEHAKFPFPQPDESRSVSTTDVSQFEVALVQEEWKAARAVRDDNIFQKLCHNLQRILGDTPLEARAETYLRESFFSASEVQDDMLGGRDCEWLTNPNESHASFSTPL